MKEKSIQKEVPIHETLRIGILLAFVGGFLDVYTYLLWGGVFANAQTGNIVLMAMHFATGEFFTSVLYIVPVVSYFLGVVLTEIIKNKLKASQIIEWQHVIIIVEIALLLIIGFLPKNIWPLLVTTTISFICSMQTNCFKISRGLPYSTTMCTGNLRSAGENCYKFFATKDKIAGEKFLRYIGIILAFCIGAGFAVLFIGLLGIKSIWICSGILFVILISMWRTK